VRNGRLINLIVKRADRGVWVDKRTKKTLTKALESENLAGVFIFTRERKGIKMFQMVSQDKQDTEAISDLLANSIAEMVGQEEIDRLFTEAMKERTGAQKPQGIPRYLLPTGYA